MTSEDRVWLFHGDEERFAGGAFTSRERAEDWIRARRLSGVLTAYPLDEGCFDWALRQGLVTGRAQSRGDDPDFVGSFTTASQEHHHYKDGQRS